MNAKKIKLFTLLGRNFPILLPVILGMVFQSSKSIKTSKEAESIYTVIEKNMVIIPGGTFEMGCTEEIKGGCEMDEKPVHTVTITSFKLNKFEVTQEEWTAVMGPGHRFAFRGCDRCPAERVTWTEVQEFIQKLNKNTGKKYRLPSEAEWEYSARGGEKFRYAGSDTFNLVGWHRKISGDKTHPVGQLMKNGYGLYDMSGNVWEWCQDKNHPYYRAYSDGRPYEEGSSNQRVLRGGSFGNWSDAGRISERGGAEEQDRFSLIGFRLAHDL